MKYTSKKQYAGMLERRANELDSLASRMRELLYHDATEHLDIAVARLRKAAKAMREEP